MTFKTFLIASKTYGDIRILIDDEDFDKVFAMNKWSASKDRGKFYFHKRISKKDKITLHRYLVNCPKGKYVDHINGNTLDNRKANLRICSNAANLRNGKIRPNNKSGYTGVFKVIDQPHRPFIAKIRVNYKNILLGSYATFDEAYKARKEAEVIYFNA